MRVVKTECSCGEPILIEINAKQTCRIDGKRPFYPDQGLPDGCSPNEYNVNGICVFRCRKCGKVIDDECPEAALGTRINIDTIIEWSAI